jgi:hypothetical protein
VLLTKLVIAVSDVPYPYPNMALYERAAGGAGASVIDHPPPIDHPGPIVIAIIKFPL